MTFVRRAYFRRPGPLGRPRARGLERKKKTTRPLQRILHASAQRAGELLVWPKRLGAPAWGAPVERG